MKQITYTDIESWKPCYSPSKHLPTDWSGTALDILEMDSVSFEDRLWVVLRTDLVSEKLIRLFAVWCARQVQHLMKDARSLNALDVAEKSANGLATREELGAAWDVARDAAWDAAWDAARGAAWDAARGVARDAARGAAWDVARDAARDAAWDAARGAAWDAARGVARGAAWDAARAAQKQKLKEMLIAGIETGDTVLDAKKAEE